SWSMRQFVASSFPANSARCGAMFPWSLAKRSLRMGGAVTLLVAGASAHHDAANGAGSTIVALQAQGDDPLPHQKAGVVASVSRASEGPTLSALSTYGLAAYLSLEVWERLYLEANVPAL